MFVVAVPGLFAIADEAVIAAQANDEGEQQPSVSARGTPLSPNTLRTRHGAIVALCPCGGQRCTPAQ